MKMKRKDLEDVNDEFSDFSLSSPARKSRRLDAELPPIMEEEDAEIPLVFEQSMPEANLSSTIERVGGGPVIEELPFEPEPENDERAIVLFKQPMNSPLLQSPSNFSIQVCSDIISGINYQVFWSRHSKPVVNSEGDEAENNAATEQSLAVVPWVPSQLPPTQNEVSESMETEEMGVAAMDTEDNSIAVDRASVSSEGLHQWPQQHCVIPQFPQNTSTPVVWYQ